MVLNIVTIVVLVGCAVALFFTRRHYRLQLKNALERAQKSDQLKSVFIDNVSHTLLAPLNAVMGYSNFIMESSDENMQVSQVKKMATNINKDCQEMIDFVKQLMEMTKLEGITPTFTFIEVNLSELMASYRREALNLTKPDVTVRVKTDLSPHCKAKLDTNFMHQLMAHLLENAAKHATNGDIVITYGQERNGLKVSVTYSGIGQAEIIGADIYSFLQKEDALKHANESAAFGLALCKFIAEVLGGEFYMDTEYDKKTAACFWFPCHMRDTHKEA